MATMTLEERQAFLADTRIGVLAVRRDGRAPLAVPIWYAYEPGGEVVVWTTKGSVKDKLLRETGTMTFTVHDDAWPYRYVSAEGPVTFDDNPSLDEVVAIAERYFPAEKARSFVEGEFGDSSMLVRMRPERWLSVDYTKD